MGLRLVRNGLTMLLGLSLIAAAGSNVFADTVAATRAVDTPYDISLFGINGNVLQNKLGMDLQRYYSKVSDTSQNAYNSSYGAQGIGSGEFQTFCVDLRQTLPTNPTKFNYATVSETSASAVGDGGGGFLSPEYFRDLGQVGWLLSNYSAGIVDGSGWTGLALGFLSEVQRAAALQAAVWVSAYGVNSFLISGGSLTQNLLVYTAATTLVNAAAGQSETVGFIDYRPQVDGSTAGFKSQDQAFAVAPVPEPSTFAIAGLGALAFLGYGMRRRRTLAATA